MKTLPRTLTAGALACVLLTTGCVALGGGERTSAPVTVLAPPLPNLMGKDGDAGLLAPAWFVPPVNSNDPGGAATGAR